MRRIIELIAVACYAVLASSAPAQEHWTEGPVWEVSFYRTKPGQFDVYMTYLRTNFLSITEEGKKQDLILERKVFVKAPKDPRDWDVAIAILYPSFGKALDFNQGDEDKSKAIQAKHYKTEDEKKQQEVTAKRFEMRDFIGTELVREVNLRPLP